MMTLSGCLAYMLMRSRDRGTYNRIRSFLPSSRPLFRAEGFRELKLSDAGRYHASAPAFERVMHVRFRRPRGPRARVAQ